MSDKPIDQRVKDIVVEQLGVKPEQVTPQAKFIEDLGADSLDTVELVMALEEEFGIEVPDEQAEKLQSVGDVIKYVEDNAEISANLHQRGSLGWTQPGLPRLICHGKQLLRPPRGRHGHGRRHPFGSRRSKLFGKT